MHRDPVFGIIHALDPLHLDSLNCSSLYLQTELPFHSAMIDRLCCSQPEQDVFYNTPVGLSPFDPGYTLENPNGIRDFSAIYHLSLDATVPTNPTAEGRTELFRNPQA